MIGVHSGCNIGSKTLLAEQGKLVSCSAGPIAVLAEFTSNLQRGQAVMLHAGILLVHAKLHRIIKYHSHLLHFIMNMGSRAWVKSGACKRCMYTPCIG